MTQSTALATVQNIATLPALIDRAVKALAGARTAAEVLEARDLASVAYDVAKKTARLAKAKQAHDEVIAAAYRAQADALEIDAQAKRRLADEYDAAQERGEVAKDGQHRAVPGGNSSATCDCAATFGDDLPRGPECSKCDGRATAADLGLSRKAIHESRIIRDAEAADPGIVKRTVDDAIAAGEEPSKAKVRRAVLKVVRPDDPTPPPRPGRGRDAICARVREAITALSGLPPASEVVGYFAGSDSTIVINEHIKQAAAWIDEFRAAWGDSNADGD